MSIKAAEKVIDALTNLLHGYKELQEALLSDFGSDEQNAEQALEMDAALVTEMRAALESLMDSEDIGAEEVAGLISVLTDALEEIDPNVFDEDEIESADDDDDTDDDIDDLDDDDLYDDGDEESDDD